MICNKTCRKVRTNFLLSINNKMVGYILEVYGKQQEATVPIQSLVKLQPWFLSMRWNTCLRQNCSVGSCACSEGPVFGQNTLMMILELIH